MDPFALDDAERRILHRIQDRLLWLAVLTIHHANARRANASPERVGGHQSSSTSSLTLLTAFLVFLFVMMIVGATDGWNPNSS